MVCQAVSGCHERGESRSRPVSDRVGAWSKRATSVASRRNFALGSIRRIRGSAAILGGSFGGGQVRNETGPHRNVGLVIETRPDWVTPVEDSPSTRAWRHQGAARGAEPGRSHPNAEPTRARCGDCAARRGSAACGWVQAALTLDAEPPRRHTGFRSGGLRPFVVGSRPTARRAEDLPLLDHRGHGAVSALAGRRAYQPYTDEELIALVADCKATIPPYCRVNRVFRDIPADDIVAGVKSSNLRQLAHRRMAERGQVCRCIRCREVRETSVTESDLHQVVHTYSASEGQEYFLSYETSAGRLAGFCDWRCLGKRPHWRPSQGLRPRKFGKSSLRSPVQR